MENQVLIAIQDVEKQCNIGSEEDVPPKEGERRFYFPICMVVCAAVPVVVMIWFNDASTLNKFCYSPSKREELWRLVTYTFLHATPIHLAFNLIMLVMFGFTFEMEHGHWKAFLLYITGGITGALGCDVFDRRRRVIGASATCSSLLMAHLAHLLINWRAVERRPLRLAVVGSFAVSDVFSWALTGYCPTLMNLSASSHAAAELNGILLGTLLLTPSDPRLCCLKCGVSALYASLLLLSFIIYDPYASELIYHHATRYDVRRLIS